MMIDWGWEVGRRVRCLQGRKPRKVPGVGLGMNTGHGESMGKDDFPLNYKTPVDISWKQLNMSLESKEEAEAGDNDFRVIWV